MVDDTVAYANADPPSSPTADATPTETPKPVAPTVTTESTKTLDSTATAETTTTAETAPVPNDDEPTTTTTSLQSSSTTKNNDEDDDVDDCSGDGATAEKQPSKKDEKKLSNRARAEARRKRILAASARRMADVSGEQVRVPTASSSSSPDAAPADDDTGAVADGAPAVPAVPAEGSSGAASAPTEDEEPSSQAPSPSKEDDTAPDGATAAATPKKLSGSARLRQMRSRRFKKQQKAETAATVKEESAKSEDGKTGEALAAAPTTPAPGGDETGGDDVVTPAAVALPSVASGDAETTTGAAESLDKEPSASAATKDDEEPSKKYLGVARMRRKMLAEKKKKEGSDVSGVKLTAAERKQKRAFEKSMVQQQKVDYKPIYLQLVVVVLLFLSGLDIGLQQSRHAVNVTAEVVWTVTVGEGLFYPFKSKDETPHDTRKFLAEDGEYLLSPEGDDSVAADDEFAHAPGKEKKHPNIDPIFRVDFDELTDYPGFFFTVARVAVSVHRVLTTVFLLYPLAIVNGLTHVPRAIVNMTCPPIMFLTSILIRRVGKSVGAGIPTPPDEEGGDSKAIDVLAMLSRAVKNFLKGSFPRVVSVYGVWADAREDLYVVLCGMLLGLVLPLMGGGGIGRSMTEEL